MEHPELSFGEKRYGDFCDFSLSEGCWNPESGIHTGLESGIHRFGMESGIRNPEGWNPESKGFQNPDAGIRNLEAGIPESRTFVDSLTWGENGLEY